MVKKKKKIEEYSELVTNCDQSKDVVANCDRLSIMDTSGNHLEKSEKSHGDGSSDQLKYGQTRQLCNAVLHNCLGDSR